MTYLSDVNVEQAIENGDFVVINRGKRTIQMSYADFIASINTGGSFADVIDSLNSDYTLVVQSTFPDTQILMNADNGDSQEITVPQGAFTIGANYTVSNASTSVALNIIESSGVTITNVTSSTQIIASAAADQGVSFATFVNTGLNTWIVYGDITGAA